MYVGMGTGSRCLDTHKRKPEHKRFIDEAISHRGISFVNIVGTGLTRSTASALERTLIKKLHPQFNIQMNGGANAGRGVSNPMSKLSEKQVLELRELWRSYSGSMRSFHRLHGADLAWTTIRKLLLGISYREING